MADVWVVGKKKKKWSCTDDKDDDHDHYDNVGGSIHAEMSFRRLKSKKIYKFLKFIKILIMYQLKY